jgi:hypothetical protein
MGATVGIFQLTPRIEKTLLGALCGATVGAVTAAVEWLWLGRRPAAWTEAATSIITPVSARS